VDPDPDLEPDADPDPAFFAIDLQDANKKQVFFKSLFAYRGITFEGTFTMYIYNV
jgi:hypothetical protein